MGKAEERIRKRRNKIIEFLRKHEAFDIEHGLTVKEITNEFDQSESVIRIDLAALKAEGVERDSKRKPNVFWLARRKG